VRPRSSRVLCASPAAILWCAVPNLIGKHYRSLGLLGHRPSPLHPMAGILMSFSIPLTHRPVPACAVNSASPHRSLSQQSSRPLTTCGSSDLLRRFHACSTPPHRSATASARQQALPPLQVPDSQCPTTCRCATLLIPTRSATYGRATGLAT
jgi:hypothetical protein